MAKIGRNSPCPCKSGKKYKHCCRSPLKDTPKAIPPEVMKRMQAALRAHEAQEHRRVQDQGHGRPIISAEIGDGRFVAVADKVRFAKNWKFFTDFLSAHIKDTLGGEWGNAEIAKPLKERHPIMQWYDAYCHFQRSHEKQPDGTYYGEATGIYYCYLGLAYNLYLIEHNAELQRRLVARLKNPEQFQSAYHELMIANILIRAGFELELEDEDDRETMHCEFSAKSIRTGKRYSVEAKMRGVAGVLGRTEADGADPDGDPTAHIVKHINAALKKPSKGERLIFVDVNTGPMKPEEFASGSPVAPPWMETAERKLRRLEHRLNEQDRAYVIVSNLAFHLSLDSEFQGHAAVTYGLGIPDFAKPFKGSLKDAWKLKQKHIDMTYISEALTSYPSIPNHFDADLPPEKEGGMGRVKIGQWYDFEDIGVRALVTSAHVSEDDKIVYLGIQSEDGEASIIISKMTDYEFDVYKKYPDTYFGVVQKINRQTNDPFEFYENIVEIHRTYPREHFMRNLDKAPDNDYLETLDDLELVLEYCERVVSSILRDRDKRK